MTLTEKLIQKQKELKYSDARFAAHLGVSRQLWSFTRTGKLRPNMKVLAGSLRAFPSLTDDVLHVLRGQDTRIAA